MIRYIINYKTLLTEYEKNFNALSIRIFIYNV